MKHSKFPSQQTAVNVIRIFTLTMLLCAGISAFGQKEFKVSLDKANVTLVNRGFHIDSVIDARSLKENIGMAQVGLNNKQVEAQFIGPFDETLMKYFKRTLPPTSGTQPIIAVVNDLRISEKTYKMKERGMADLDITFCRLDSGKLYSLKTIENHQETGGMDVTLGHESRLADALAECLKEFNDSEFRTIHGSLYAAGADWQSIDAERDIFRCTDRIAGSYSNFKEMRSNSPLEHGISLEPRGILFVARDSQNNKKLKEAFGVCDGTFIYINTLFYNTNGAKGMFARVMEEGRIMLWYDHYMSATEAGLAAGFGLVGSAIAASDTDLIGLDMKTGVIKPIKIKSLEQLLQEDPELLAQYQSTNDKGNVAVMKSFVKRFNSRHKP